MSKSVAKSYNSLGFSETFSASLFFVLIFWASDWYQLSKYFLSFLLSRPHSICSSKSFSLPGYENTVWIGELISDNLVIVLFSSRWCIALQLSSFYSFHRFSSVIWLTTISKFLYCFSGLVPFNLFICGWFWGWNLQNGCFNCEFGYDLLFWLLPSYWQLMIWS